MLVALLPDDKMTKCDSEGRREVSSVACDYLLVGDFVDVVELKVVRKYRASAAADLDGEARCGLYTLTA